MPATPNPINSKLVADSCTAFYSGLQVFSDAQIAVMKWQAYFAPTGQSPIFTDADMSLFPGIVVADLVAAEATAGTLSTALTTSDNAGIRAFQAVAVPPQAGRDIAPTSQYAGPSLGQIATAKASPVNVNYIAFLIRTAGRVLAIAERQIALASQYALLPASGPGSLSLDDFPLYVKNAPTANLASLATAFGYVGGIKTALQSGGNYAALLKIAQ
jgi:hypothetical protein